MVNEMAMSHNKKEFVAVVLLDMEKAFDRVWHQGLLYKLSKVTPRRVYNVLQSYLQNRRFAVQVEDQTSTEKPAEAGVPQGSCIAPVCYAWYTDDIPVVGQAQLALYADDAAYFASSYKPAFAAKRLQPTLDALPEWLGKWRLAANVAKTQALITGRAALPPPLKLLGREIPWQKEVTYLGVKLSRGLNFSSHVDAIISRVKRTRAALRPILKSRLPPRTKIMIYKAYVRTRLTYAAPGWYPYTSATCKKKLQAQENLVLREIVGAPRYVRNSTIQRDLKWENLERFIRRLATKMFEKADTSGFEHVCGIAPLHARPPDMPNKRKSKPYSRELILRQPEDEPLQHSTHPIITPTTSTTDNAAAIAAANPAATTQRDTPPNDTYTTD